MSLGPCRGAADAAGGVRGYTSTKPSIYIYPQHIRCLLALLSMPYPLLRDLPVETNMRTAVEARETRLLNSTISRHLWID